MSRKNDKPRYQTGRYEDDGKHVKTDHTAKFVRVVAPDRETCIEVSYIGARQFHVHASSRLILTADSSNDFVLTVQRNPPTPKRTHKKAAGCAECKRLGHYCGGHRIGAR